MARRQGGKRLRLFRVQLPGLPVMEACPRKQTSSQGDAYVLANQACPGQSKGCSTVRNGTFIFTEQLLSRLQLTIRYANS